MLANKVCPHLGPVLLVLTFLITLTGYSFVPVFSQNDVFNQDRQVSPNGEAKGSSNQENSDASGSSQKENTKKWFEFKNSVTDPTQLILKISQSDDFRIVLPLFNGSQPVFGRTSGGIVGEIP